MVKFVFSASGGPGFHGFVSWARTRYHSLGHAEVAFHVPQLGGPTTKNTQLCTGGIWGEKAEKKILNAIEELKDKFEKNFQKTEKNKKMKKI